MLFNSIIFLLFALIFFIGWKFAKKSNNHRWIYITVASFIFYGWWDWRFIFLIIGSGLIDFFAGLGIKKYPKQKKILLLLSLLGNLGSLIAFKYSFFISNTIERIFEFVGITVDLNSHIPLFFTILPVGISFYTFQSMSYTIDVYKGKLEPTKKIFHFFAYLAMFPQLVAGPIVRAQHFLYQLTKNRETNETERWNAVKLIMIGFFKKVVLADNIAGLVNYAFENPVMNNSSLYWWIAVTGFAFQIYFDFSGYSDIARGLAKLMGYHFRLNFNHPYISLSIREFWTRWHISLSTWFRDYVYIPLGGSRKGQLRSHINMWITMIVSGIWHGAAFTFIFWGALHAFYLSMERIFKIPQRLKKIKGGMILSLFLVIVQVWIAWVFFRANGLKQALLIIKTMLFVNLNGFVINSSFINSLIFIFIGIFIELFIFLKVRKIIAIPNTKNRTLEIAYIIFLALVCIFFRGEGAQFIYFQF